MKNENFDRTRYAYKISIVTIILNAVLSAIKLVVGIIGSSAALISDAVHSLSDVLSTFVVMMGVKISGKETDANHQYGHEKFEAVAGTLLSVFLFGVALSIGYSGVKLIISGEYLEAPAPSAIALAAAIISIGVKEWMFWYTKAAAEKINSSALMADAWHHRSDSFSSIGSLIGIGGAIFGFKLLDPLASVIICLFIVKVSYEIFIESVNQTVDTAAKKEVVDKIHEAILSVEGVVGIDILKTRMHANRLYVDTEIVVSNTLSLVDAHNISEEVHDKIEETFPTVKHCMVHVNPS